MKVSNVVGIVIFAILIVGLLFALGSLKSGDIKSSSDVNVELPAPTDYLIDESGVLTVQQKSDIKSQLFVLDNTKAIQVGVLVVKTTAPLSIEEYGIRVAEKWKVGLAGLDNGAIIIVATEDRKVRIEVGYGLEGVITDAKAGDIIDSYMIPSLKTSDWAGAIKSGITGIQKYNK